MLDGLKRNIAASVITKFLQSLATSKDTQTSVTGLLAGAILAIHGLNMGSLLAGDPHQVALVTSGLAVWGIGLLATRENHDGHTTLLGVVAAAAQAYVGDFTAALSLGLVGYLTNKPVAKPTSEVKR